MQLSTSPGRRPHSGRFPSVFELFLSRWLRFATLVWVAIAIALAVPAQVRLDRDAPGEQVQFLPPMPPANAGIVAQPESLTQRLQPLAPFFAQQEGGTAMTLIDSGHHVVFEANPHQTFMLASVTKLYILTAYLNLVASENRELNGVEHQLLENMIEASDNYSASILWDRIGKADGLQRYLASRALPPIVPPPDDEEWGDTRADAVSVGALLSGLYDGRLLTPEFRNVALDLLSNVVDSQSWGLGEAKQAPDGSTREVYMKNGWYPQEEGWVVNSTGIVVDRTGHYVMVLLTDKQPSFEAGVELVQTAAGFVSDRLP